MANRTPGPMTGNSHDKHNEGEGSQTGARQYREGLSSFRKSGRVDEAARNARDAVDSGEGESLRSAEAAGKSRMAEEDPEFETLPRWWREDYRSGWERVKAALRRDWEQTLHDIRHSKGHDLNQSVGDTLRQARGAQNIPPPEQPNRSELSFREAESALRFGYGAAQHYSTASWSPELEDSLRHEWDGYMPEVEWDSARPYVRHVFSLSRTNLH